MTSPRVILIDIETFPNIGYTWGHYEQNVLAYVREWRLASVAWKELGRGTVKALSLPDFGGDEAKLIKGIRHEVDQADVLIGHNIDRFDSPMLRTKFVMNGQHPTSYRTIDTRKIAKSQFRFNSNKLDDLANTLGLGRKLQTGGFELWRRCMNDEPAAWRTMVRYNKQDVVLLEKVYLKLRSWYPSHPNFALYSGVGDRPECTVCESVRTQRRGYRVMVGRRAERYQCLKCGHWFSRPLSMGDR